MKQRTRTANYASLFVLLLSSVSVSASDQIVAAPQSHPILLRGGTIHPVSQPVIQGGEILFVDGRIAEIGLHVAVTENTEIVNIRGRHVYPGLIDAQTNMGLVEIAAVRATRDVAEAGEINPNIIAARAYNPDSEMIPVTRANGVTVVHTIPEQGLLAGISSVMMLEGWTGPDAALKTETAMIMNWPNLDVPASITDSKKREKREKSIRKSVAKIDETFEAAQAYRLLRDAGATISVDLRHEALIRVMEGHLALFIRANRLSQINAAVAWSRKWAIPITIMGGEDSWLVADLLAAEEIAVIVDRVHSVPSRREAEYHQNYSLPGRLADAGVRFCIATGHWSDDQVRNLPYSAGIAAAFGLDPDEALKSVTLYPARILGVADRVGSLDVGKDATLMITSGDPLDIRTHVIQVYIQGRKIDMGNRHKALYKKYRERYRQMGRIE